MRDVKITCDKCGEEIKLHSGSQTDLSGIIVRFFRRQIGSIPTYEEYELCDTCASEVKDFILPFKKRHKIIGDGEL